MKFSASDASLSSSQVRCKPVHLFSLICVWSNYLITVCLSLFCVAHTAFWWANWFKVFYVLSVCMFQIKVFTQLLRWNKWLLALQSGAYNKSQLVRSTYKFDRSIQFYGDLGERGWNWMELDANANVCSWFFTFQLVLSACFSLFPPISFQLFCLL